MPFDSMLGETDQIAIARRNRQRAATLWGLVRPAQFNMEDWDCGSAACALGWLARSGIDGWKAGDDSCPEFGDYDSYDAAAVYFGLSLDDAEGCFGTYGFTARLHGRTHISMVTPADVAATLMRLPYEVETEDAYILVEVDCLP
jgi:hypothetical protein